MLIILLIILPHLNENINENISDDMTEDMVDDVDFETEGFEGEELDIEDSAAEDTDEN